MNSFKIIFSSIIFAFGSIAYAECSNPKQQVPNLDNYWELKIAQGFNDMKVIKQLDSKYCYNYLINNQDYGSPLFQMLSLEQVDFFIQKIPTFKAYKTPDTELDLLLYTLSMPYMYYDYVNDDLKNYLISRYKRSVPDATVQLFDEKIHNFWFNEDDLKKYPQRLKELINYANGILPLFNKSDLNKKDTFGNNALHYAVMIKNSKPITYFNPTGLEALKKNDLGANLWHFAFLPAPKVLPKAYVDAELKVINKHLLDNFKPSHIRFMTLGNPLNKEYPQTYPFEIFAYKFRDNNPELYTALKTKYPEIFMLSDEELEENSLNTNEIEKVFNDLIIQIKDKIVVRGVEDR